MDDWSSGGYRFDTQAHNGGVAQNQPEPAACEDDEMAAFEAACERRLKEERQKRAQAAGAGAASADRPAPEPEPVKAPSDEPAPQEQAASQPPAPEPTQPEPPAASEPSDEPVQAQNAADTAAAESIIPPRPKKRDSELSQIVHNEAAAARRYETALPEEETEADDEDDGDEPLPGVVRFIFTILLLALGAVGMYLLVGMDYHSYLLDPLCFAEISVCMLTAIGMNAAAISSRIGKVLIMRTAAWFLFLFYCLYAANELFLHKMIEDHFVIGSFFGFARSHITMDFGALRAYDIAECAMFILPFAFLLPMVLGFLRNFVLYVFAMLCSVGGVAALRVVSMAGGVDLARCCVALGAAVVVYIIFMLPPLQNLMRGAGLCSWEEIYYDD